MLQQRTIVLDASLYTVGSDSLFCRLHNSQINQAVQII